MIVGKFAGYARLSEKRFLHPSLYNTYDVISVMPPRMDAPKGGFRVEQGGTGLDPQLTMEADPQTLYSVV